MLTKLPVSLHIENKEDIPNQPEATTVGEFEDMIKQIEKTQMLDHMIAFMILTGYKEKRDTMLSTEGKEFLIKLREKLASVGKNNVDINNRIDEMERRLIEAEAHGKSVDDVIGDPQNQLIKDLKSEMTGAIKGIFKVIAMLFILMITFFDYFTAIRGSFQLHLYHIGTIAGTGIILYIIYSIFLYNINSLFIKNKAKYISISLISVLSMIAITTITLIYLNVNQTTISPATPMQNTLILIACIVIFILSCLFFKSTLLLGIILLTSIAPVIATYYPNLRAPLEIHPALIWIPLVIGCIALFSFIIWCAVDDRFKGTFFRKMIDKLSQ
ncbi:hypothetical protein HXA31_17325 [Salipaludibacillus agaradhaerens]|uniref:Uncharacterized protein n=1 Tax=Salipaludibacillus agaradhaerens TaxID=76935 RepID=A0A9Q4G0Q3_SALAG|nr:hypothetical protein [Salipaludibacillus agaradhaerens]MCR6098267.1 hypothetical protein [Salipaludibacillus agaradhaerens]MCR6116103.1 hypothetical protein [Salipaludibacillus agaradhaerens]